MKFARKLLLSSAAILSATTIPAVGLTSCNTTWGYKSPYMIGDTGTSDGPYGLLLRDTKPFYDADGKNMLDYLQSNYSIQQTSSTNRAYSLPYKAGDATGTEGSKTITWSANNVGWYSSSDDVFTTTKQYTDKNAEGKEVTKTSTNARNAVLSGNVDMVCGIGAMLKQYFDYAFSYASSQLVSDSSEEAKNKMKADLGVLFGSELEYKLITDSTTTSNREFYEFLTSMANSHIGYSKGAPVLRNSNILFDFTTMPIPSYAFTDVTKPETRSISEATWKLLTGKTSMSADEVYYTSKSEYTEDNITYDVYTFNSVPVLINDTFVTYKYLDSGKKDSYIVNDYFVNDVNSVRDAVGSSWKDVLHNTAPELERDDCIPHYSKFVVENDTGITIDKGDKRDKRLFTDDYNLYVDYFICLYKYTVRIARADASGEHKEKNTVVLNQLENVFPAYFIYAFGDEMFKKCSDNEKAMYVIDQDKVNYYNNRLLDILKRTPGYAAHASDLSSDDKKLVSLLGNMWVDVDKDVDTDGDLSVEEF